MKKIFIPFLFLLVIAGKGYPFPTVTGGTITTNGDYRIHKFTNSGSFIVSGGDITCETLFTLCGKFDEHLAIRQCSTPNDAPHSCTLFDLERILGVPDRTRVPGNLG